MKSILNIGMTGTGKTTEAKKQLAIFADRPKLIYDVNGEYTKGAKLPTMEDFMKACKKATNSVLLFEEATMFFSARGRSADMVDLLVRKRHTNNVIIMNFHSFRTIPTYIIEMIDYMYIKRTNDTEKRVRDKFDSEILSEKFVLCQEKSKFDPFFTVKVSVKDL